MMLFKYKSLLFFIILLGINSYSKTDSLNAFNKFADEVNLIVSRELLLEIRENTIYGILLNNIIKYDDLVSIIPSKYKNNLKLANRIDSLRSSFEKSHITNKLDGFRDSVISFVPTEGGTDKRKSTIDRIRAQVNELISRVNKKDINDQTSQTAANNIKSASEPFSLELIIIALLNLVFIICFVIIFIKSNHLNKKIHQKFREMKDDYFKPLKDKMEQNKVMKDNTLQKDYLSGVNEDELSKKIIQWQKNETETTLKSSINNLPIINNKIPAHQENTRQVFYAESPEGDGFFSRKYLTQEAKSRSFYKIIENNGHAVFDILDNKTFHREVMNNTNTILKPACEFEIEPKPTDQYIYKINPNSQGSIIIENDKYVIADKIKIGFK